MREKKDNIKAVVKQKYGEIAAKGTSCCSSGGCCGGKDTARDIAKVIGYSEQEMSSVPEGANLGLGCGNPVAIAALKEGDTVLDLGSGAGFDVFLCARQVGISGRVIGVDMTPEMISRARANALKGGYFNVEFRLGEIEKLPVDDNSIDVIISNCVINLSPRKQNVFQEAYRVLKNNGRLMVSDLVLIKPLPAKMKKSVEAYVGCLAGASMREEYLGYIRRAGFQDVEIIGEAEYPVDAVFEQLAQAQGAVVSIKIMATKKESRGGK